MIFKPSLNCLVVMKWIIALTLFGFYVVQGHPGDSAVNASNVFSLDDLEVKAKGVINTVFAKALPSVLRSSNGKVSLDCNIALIRLTMGLRKLDGWALRVLDSTGKPPGGIFKGTLTAFGSYDECVEIKVPSKSTRFKEKVHFQGKYCSVQLHPADGLFTDKADLKSKLHTAKTNENGSTIISQFKKYGKFMASAYLRFGVCVPAACNETDILQLSQSILSQLELPAKIKIRRCEIKQDLNLTPTHISVMTIVGVLSLTLFMGSCFDVILNKKRAIAIRILTSFSVNKNIQELFTVHRSKYEITCLDGIRFVTSLWIILGHTYMLPLGVHYTRFRNVSQFVKFQNSFSFAPIGNFYLSVDTFFFVSGLLLIYTKKRDILEGKSSIYFFTHVLRRLWRISPVYFFIIGLFILLPLLGTGPMWYDAVESQAEICYKYWWASLLYIQNFWPIKENCMLHSWYLAATLQIHAISFFILWPMLKNVRLGLFVNTLALIASIFLTGFITFWYDLKPTMDVLGGHATLDGVTSFIYIRPYSHLPAFAVGIFFGCLLVYTDKVVLSKVFVIVGSIIALAINMLVIYGLHDYYKGASISTIETILYAALHRPSWAVTVGWLVFLCATGNGGILNTVLSWRVFAPLAKLSFAAYLIHPLIILYQLGSSRERIYLGHFEMIMNSVSVSCVSYVIAVFLHVGIEVPCLKIERLILVRFCNQNDVISTSKEATNDLPLSVVHRTVV